MALVRRLDDVCNDATVFLAMISYLISLWIVIFFRIGLNFLISILSGVFFLFLVVMYREVPGIPEFLCSVHSKITWTLLPFLAMRIQLLDQSLCFRFF